jgi:hypothetical protein
MRTHLAKKSKKFFKDIILLFINKYILIFDFITCILFN